MIYHFLKKIFFSQNLLLFSSILSFLSKFYETSLALRQIIDVDEMTSSHCAHLWLGTWDHRSLISIIYANEVIKD
jgi:hypothetical protein